jgi:hypothetical protein
MLLAFNECFGIQKSEDVMKKEKASNSDFTIFENDLMGEEKKKTTDSVYELLKKKRFRTSPIAITALATDLRAAIAFLPDMAFLPEVCLPKLVDGPTVRELADSMPKKYKKAFIETARELDEIFIPGRYSTQVPCDETDPHYYKSRYEDASAITARYKANAACNLKLLACVGKPLGVKVDAIAVCQEDSEFGLGSCLDSFYISPLKHQKLLRHAHRNYDDLSVETQELVDQISDHVAEFVALSLSQGGEAETALQVYENLDWLWPELEQAMTALPDGGAV